MTLALSMHMFIWPGAWIFLRCGDFHWLSSVLPHLLLLLNMPRQKMMETNLNSPTAGTGN